MTTIVYTTDHARMGLCEFEQVGDPAPVWKQFDYTNGWCSFDQIGKVVGEPELAHIDYLKRCAAAYNKFLTSSIRPDGYCYLPRDAATDVVYVPQGAPSFCEWRKNARIVASVAGMYMTSNAFICSPLLVAERFHQDGTARVKVYAQIGTNWKIISLPLSILADSGTKLRAMLLEEGVNVSVYPEPRRRLMHYLLNARPLLEGGAQ